MPTHKPKGNARYIDPVDTPILRQSNFELLNEENYANLEDVSKSKTKPIDETKKVETRLTLNQKAKMADGPELINLGNIKIKSSDLRSLTSESKSVILHNLPFDYTLNDLKKKFGTLPYTKDIRLVTKSTGESKGFGYIDFDNRKAALEFIEDYHRTFIGKSELRVEFAIPLKKHHQLLGKDKAKGQIISIPQRRFIPLIVHNLPTSLTNEELTNIFRSAEGFIDSNIITDDEGSSLGFGSLDFNSRVNAENALKKYQGFKIGRFTLKLDISANFDINGTIAKGLEESQTLIIHNLPKDISDHELKQAFRVASGYLHSRVTYDSDGTPRGIGYVDFDSRENTEAALNIFDEAWQFGINLKLDIANPLTESTRNYINANKRQPNCNNAQSHSKEKTNLMVFNLSKNVTEKILSDLFRNVKGFENTQILSSSTSPNNFGFINFESLEPLMLVYNQFQGYELEGKRLRLQLPNSYQQSKSKQEPTQTADFKIIVIVHHLSNQVTQKVFKKIFSKVEGVIRGEVVYDDAKKPRGYGTLIFDTIEHAESAITEFEHFEIKNQKVRLQIKPDVLSAIENQKKKSTKLAKKNHSNGIDGIGILIVHKIPPDLTLIELSKAFEKFYGFVRAELVFDKDGKRKSYGYIILDSLDSIKKNNLYGNKAGDTTVNIQIMQDTEVNNYIRKFKNNSIPGVNQLPLHKLVENKGLPPAQSVFIASKEETKLLPCEAERQAGFLKAQQLMEFINNMNKPAREEVDDQPEEEEEKEKEGETEGEEKEKEKEVETQEEQGQDSKLELKGEAEGEEEVEEEEEEIEEEEEEETAPESDIEPEAATSGSSDLERRHSSRKFSGSSTRTTPPPRQCSQELYDNNEYGPAAELRPRKLIKPLTLYCIPSQADEIVLDELFYRFKGYVASKVDVNKEGLRNGLIYFDSPDNVILGRRRIKTRGLLLLGKKITFSPPKLYDLEERELRSRRLVTEDRRRSRRFNDYDYESSGSTTISTRPKRSSKTEHDDITEAKLDQLRASIANTIERMKIQ